MLLATILLLAPIPQNWEAAKIAVTSPAAVTSSSSDELSSLSRPTADAPEPKIKSDAEVAANPGIEPGPALQPVKAPAAAPILSVKPAVLGSGETPTQRKLWYALAFTGSGAAAFDAWSTRRAITTGYGVEGNPMLRPFSHSNVLYGAVQVSPLLMDFIGKRMMSSRFGLLRKTWWVPQAAGSGVSIAAGVHNVGLVP